MKKLFTLLILSLMALSLSACMVTDPEDNEEITVYDQETFSEVFEHLLENHYSQTGESVLWEGAIQGLIDSLEDPYTRYLSAEEFEAFQNSLGESFVGIGVLVENINDTVRIQQVFDNSPAQRAGILPGDVITHVDGVDYRDQSYYDILSSIVGEEGTDVEVGLERVGRPDILYLTMTRAVISNPSVAFEIFEENDKTIGYIEVSSFGEFTFYNFNSFLAVMEIEQDIDALIIDLRGNGGGYLTTVQNMLNMFLSSEGLPMFQIEEYSNGERSLTEYFANNADTKDYPIITLINGFSASASEVFAAGMMEAGGYETLGTNSFGKGTMQVPKSLASTEGDELQASVGRWLTPEGNWVNNKGGDMLSITPTHVVEQNPVFNAFSVYLDVDEMLGFDQVDEKIKNVQVILNALGYEVRSDGYFDLNTENAVKAYQQSHDLDPTGIIDYETASQLSSDLFEYKQNLENDTQLQEAIQLLSR